MSDSGGTVQGMGVEGNHGETCSRCATLETQIEALKEVSNIRKSLVEIREREAKDLISRLHFFEKSMAEERKSREDISVRVDAAEQQCCDLLDKLKQKQDALRDMRSIYEAKIEALTCAMEKLDYELKGKEKELWKIEERNSNLLVQVRAFQTESDAVAANPNDRLSLSDDSDEKSPSSLSNPASELEVKLKNEVDALSKKNQILCYQMTLLNSLFSETEMTSIDFDKIKTLGELGSLTPEDLLPTSTENTFNEGLPVEKTDDGSMTNVETGSDESPTQDIPGEESCYKRVEDETGPKLILSVSLTFIKLKDLILEKKAMQKDIQHLKEVNTKIIAKLDKKERRFYSVAMELNKTWNLVSKLKLQHNRISDSKAALRHELQEKRKLLERLKSDLSEFRDNCLIAKLQNSATEMHCQQIRAEFARRKQEASGSTQSQSQESAFFEKDSISSVIQDPESNDNNIEDNSEVMPRDPVEFHDEPQPIAHDGARSLEPDFEDEFVSDLVQQIDGIAEAVENDGVDEDELEDSGLTLDEIVNRRTQRLRDLEEQCRLLYVKLQASTARNTALATRLADLHSHYGSENSPESEMDLSMSQRQTEELSNDTAYASVSLFGEDSIDTEMISEIESHEDHVIPLSHIEMISLEADAVEVTPELYGPPNHNYITESLPSFFELNGREHVERNPIDVRIFPSQDARRASEANDQQIETLHGQGHGAEARAQAHNGPSTNVPDEKDQILDFPAHEERASSSPDFNELGRLIIQQLSKRLDFYKKENLRLKKDSAISQSGLEDSQKEVEDQREIIGVLENQLKDQTEMELHFQNSMESRERDIGTLRTEILVVKTAFERLYKEKVDIETLVGTFTEENNLLRNREETKSRSKVQKNCQDCKKSFSILRRKCHCQICGYGICKSCALGRPSNSVSAGDGRKQKKARFCAPCHARRLKLDNNELLKNEL